MLGAGSFALICLLASCAAPTPALRPARGAEQRVETEHWLRTELYFGIGPLDDVSAAAHQQRWREFLDREITPRFPDGLTIYDVHGQWRASGRSEIQHERSKEVMLIYRDTAQHRADIEAIRAAWKKLSGDESVLRVTQPAEVAF
ncbi:MAG: DUF3574 domain-containing protein [Gammaproteobacteria bacterium]|nr:MAG: DUF3574 domain-containing protein [Gammaproteobacteria bacterium]